MKKNSHAKGKIENDQTEPRFVCNNWEPHTKVTFNGASRPSIRRKVVTNETWHINSDEAISVLAEAKRKLRQGYLVFIGSDIILSPMMESDLSGMYVSARAVHGLRDCLSDKTATISYCGKELDEEGRDELMSEQKERYEQQKKTACVTPDTMIECPKCGFKMRVGKVLSATK